MELNMKEYTEQEKFWKGDFGDKYVDRMHGDKFIASNLSMFSSVLKNITNVDSIVEFGSNIGLNLRALRLLLPDVDLCGVEINKKAADILRKWGGAEVIESSIFDVKLNQKSDLSLIKGVMIHLNPEKIPMVYKTLYDSSNKYICIAEYYNPEPIELDYRGNSERLFKRDFAGEIMDMYPDLKLLDYGVTYKRDTLFNHDDLNWYLLEK